jgi:S1-C subfamily serine protease
MAHRVGNGDLAFHLLNGGASMPDQVKDALTQFSDALAARTAAARAFVVGIRVAHSRPRSAILWRADVAVAAEQVFPKTEEADVMLAGGAAVRARVAGRDRGTNVVALRLERPVEAGLPAAADPRLGGLTLVFGADASGEPIMRLGVVRALGPAWQSLAGGRIDRRIVLDLAISSREEGGPVLDAAGGLLGMSTAGPDGRALVIPTATVDQVLTPLLAAGRVERGWLGVALHPVALSAAVTSAVGQDRGLMVMQVTADGPAAKAGVLAGDILVAVGGAPAIRPRDIARQLGPESVGKLVELRLLRSGSPLALSATVSARPAE